MVAVLETVSMTVELNRHLLPAGRPAHECRVDQTVVERRSIHECLFNQTLAP